MVSKAKRSRLPVRPLNQGAGSPAAGGVLPGGAVTASPAGLRATGARGYGGPRGRLPTGVDPARRRVYGGPIDVVDSGEDVLGPGERGRHRPALVGVVADADGAGMGRLVAVDDRIRIVEAEPVADEPEVGRLSGEEEPARLHAVHRRVDLEVLRAVLLGLQRDRVHEHIPPYARAEELLHADQVVGHGGADAVALGIHHVDQDDLATDQVVVEADPLALVGGQYRVREVLGT